jgi:hypothetical protein
LLKRIKDSANEIRLVSESRLVDAAICREINSYPPKMAYLFTVEILCQNIRTKKVSHDIG